MPELPEVETIARGLHNALVGKTIDRAVLLRPKVALYAGKRPFTEVLPGEEIVAVGRRGKHAVISFASGRALVTHLRMTGRLVVQGPEAGPYHPYTNVALHFNDGDVLCFADVRQFGRMRLVEPEEPWASELGLEPLSEDFTPERLRAMLAGRTTPIKAWLLDQRRVAGIGNIYACEALWEAGIRPNRAAKSLSRPSILRLHHALRRVLLRSIEMRGTSVDDYVDAQGVQGGFQNELSVYGCEGKACRNCGRPIVRTVIAQRGTWWCRSCQR